MATTTLQERVMIQDLARTKMNDAMIARQLHLSVHTVRKWRRRAQRQGTAGLRSQLGRPRRGSMNTFPAELVETVRAWRQAHPGWGPKTLRSELRCHAAFAQQPVPSESTLRRWLKQAALARPYAKHQALPSVAVSPTHACHEEWEIDARGYEKLGRAGVIALINVNDVFSKVKIMSYPCWLGETRATRHATTADYQLVLRLAFSEWGLPDRLAVDHESVFYDSGSKSPYPTLFHLWVVALGINLTFGRMGQPKDQATTERSHQTWEHQVLEGQHFDSPDVLGRALNQRRAFLNRVLPCASLGECPPLVAHPEALTPRRIYRPEWEGELLDLPRVSAYLAQGRWFRKASNIGAVSLGDHRYALGAAWAKHEVTITFAAEDQHFVFQAPDGKTKRLPAHGLTASDLMGELGPLVQFHDFQLALPFSWNDWRHLQLSQLLTGTTL
jgi:transposase